MFTQILPSNHLLPKNPNVSTNREPNVPFTFQNRDPKISFQMLDHPQVSKVNLYRVSLNLLHYILNL